MGLLFDKYIPQEGLNSIFSDMQNCEIEVRPSQEWYNAPYFYLRKRKWLQTKTWWKTWYKARSWELEKLWFTTMTAAASATYVPSWIKVKPLKNAILTKVRKSNYSKAYSVAIVDGKFNILQEKKFEGNDAVVEVNLDKGQEYYILWIGKDNWKYTTAKQSAVKYPIKKWENYQIVSGIWEWDTQKLETTLESGQTWTSNNVWWIVYRVNKPMVITSIKKFNWSWATQVRFCRYDNNLKKWWTPETTYYDWDKADLPKWYVLKKWDKFWVANTANGSNFTFITLNNEYPTNINNDIKPIGSVRNWAVYDEDWDWTGNYYQNRFEIAKVEYVEAYNEIWDEAYNFTELAISERDETSIKQNYWKTIGDIVESKMFDDKMWMYTKKWYLYNFDWTDLNIISAVKQNISYLVSGKAFQLKNDSPEYVLRIWNTFKLDKTWVLTDVQLRMRVKWKLSPSVFVRCHICTLEDSKTIIASSNTIVEYSSLSEDYKNINFKFTWIELEGWEQYFFYVEAYYTDKDWYIEIDWNATSTYSGQFTREYNSKTEEWEAKEWMIWFHINTTTPLYIDQENYDDCMLVVDYLGWGVYPSDTSIFTVKSYDMATWKVTLNESTLTENYIWKIAYVQSWWDAKYQERVVASITSNTFSTPAWFSIPPVAGDKIIFYNSMEQQLWIPQIRKWSWKTDSQYMFCYDRSWNVMWRFFDKRRNMVMWDNRVLQLTYDRLTMIPSSNIDYEMPILNVVSFWNSKAKNMAAYGWYLIVFFEDKIWLVKKETVNAETWEFNYTYQDLLDIWLYSRESFLIQWGNLYIFADDKRLYSVDLSTISLWEIIWKLEDQWSTLINYFDKFDGWTVRMYYESWVLYIVYRSTQWWSEVFKYYETFKAWLQDKYEYSWNFMNFFYTLKQDKYIPSGDTIYKMSGLNDDWKEIEQHIKVYWPVEWMHDLFTVVMSKLRLWLAEDWIGWKVKITVWWFRPFTKYWNLEDLDIIKEINTFVDRDGTMGSDKTGNVMYWWEGSLSLSELLQKFSEIIDVSFKVGKKWTYFTIELINTTDRQLKLGAIVPYYNTDNPLAHYNKWVMR